jgi:hypothetical protein
MSAVTEPVALADLVAAVRRQLASAAPPTWMATSLLGATTSVRGAHQGAGASTVSVALAEALAEHEAAGATIVDLTDDESFGACATIEARADLGLRGWSGGRRGKVRVVRPTSGISEADAIPGSVVVDTGECGWSGRSDVLVLRATIPSVLRVEQALASSSAYAIAVVAATRWPSAVRASRGPLLMAVEEENRIVFFPREAELEISGLSADDLPASTRRSAIRLRDLLGREDRDQIGATA